jgi:ribosomal protein L37AE/L43A
VPWEYRELPEPLRVPPCSRCGNRGQVRQIVASIFLCLDCQPAHLFRAVWKEEARRVVAKVKAG